MDIGRLRLVVVSMIVVALAGLFGFAVLHSWITGVEAFLGVLGVCVFGRQLQAASASAGAQSISKHTWRRDLSWALGAFAVFIVVSWIYMLRLF